MSERILWIPNGLSGYLGHVGTLEPWLFQIWGGDSDPEGTWILQTVLPGFQFNRWDTAPDIPALKATAEKWLQEWLGIIGADFTSTDIPVLGANSSDEEA